MMAPAVVPILIKLGVAVAGGAAGYLAARYGIDPAPQLEPTSHGAGAGVGAFLAYLATKWWSKRAAK
jgi:hypothetical protein